MSTVSLIPIGNLDATPKQNRKHSQRSSWLELIASFLAIAGAIASVLAGFRVREWQSSASDLKTVYASALCFRQHIDPYTFRNIAAVFHNNHVVLPTSWYGHAPVYPPFTLAALAPLTLFPMVHAVYVWIAISGVALALASFLLTQIAGRLFGLTFVWRLVLIALFAASPLVSFSLELANVSAVVGSLAIAAVVLREISPRLSSFASVALALALLLKPHLAFWVILALVVSHRKTDRRLAFASLGVFLGALLLLGLWMAAHHQLAPEIASYRAIVHEEIAGGSMAPTNRELIGVAAQITSLASLLGFWLSGLPLMWANATLLLALFSTLVYLSLTISRKEPGTLLLRVGAWSAFGLLATYHRAHDGIVLLIVLPWLLLRLRSAWRNPIPWLLLAFSCAMGIGPSWETYGWLTTKPGLAHIAQFLLFRQAALATALLLLVLLAALARNKVLRISQADVSI